MEPPATFEADALRDEKVKVLRAITRRAAEPSRERRRARPVRAGLGRRRPRSRGYREEPEVDPESETETFVAARLTIDDWRWAGVPVLPPDRQAAAQARDRDRDPVPARSRTACSRTRRADPDPNLLAIRIQPDEGIMLRFGAKVPGLGLDVRSVTMDFTYGSAFSVDSPDAYETLILDALLGDASLFTRADEVEEAWGDRRPDHRRLGRRAAARLPELRGRHLGTARGRRAARPATGRRWRRI